MSQIFNRDFIQSFDPKFLERKNWGWKYSVYTDTLSAVDLCWTFEGGYCSWHSHDQLYNSFLVVQGKLLVEREHSPGGKKIELQIGENEAVRKTVVFPKHKHQFTALTDCLFLEVAFIKFPKDDINRLTTGGLKRK